MQITTLSMELPIIYNDHTQTQNLRNKKPSMHNAETGFFIA